MRLDWCRIKASESKQFSISNSESVLGEIDGWRFFFRLESVYDLSGTYFSAFNNKRKPAQKLFNDRHANSVRRFSESYTSPRM